MSVAYGGAIYASLPAAQLGLSGTPQHLGELIALGREIKWALNDTEYATHPPDLRLTGIYGTIWVDDLGDTAGQVHQRNVTVFADGQVDRSPCGSGTCARLAVLAAAGRLHRAEHVEVDGRRAVIPRSPARPTAPASTCSPSIHTTRCSTGKPSRYARSSMEPR